MINKYINESINEPIYYVTATTQTTTSGTTMEEFSTTTTLNQQTSTTDSDSTTLTDETTTVTGLQTPTGIVITSCLHHTPSNVQNTLTEVFILHYKILAAKIT